VEEGSRLVNEAGASIAGIVAQIRRAADLIGEVSSAVTEQSGGIGEINTAVSQMDAFTQQNSALVEQSAAASTSLSEQARLLSEAVSTFRLSGRADASAHDGAGDAPIRSKS
jgi:methyl-accepting chemotaxis protein